MNLFIDRHQHLIKSLLDEQVSFIIIGGYSVIYYGYKRTTGDVDVWVKPDNESKLKLVSALRKNKVSEKSISEISACDFTKHLVVSIWNPPEKVYFITHINHVKFDEADKQKVIADIDGLQVPFIHINHLVLAKINTGRAKDKGDIDELQKILQLKKKK